MHQIIGEASRVRESDAGEGQAFLSLQIRDLFSRTVAQRMRMAGGEARVKQSGHIVCLHGAVGHARAGDVHLNQGLEPQKAA